MIRFLIFAFVIARSLAQPASVTQVHVSSAKEPGPAVGSVVGGGVGVGGGGFRPGLMSDLP
jgi:hypothetical protein